MIEMQWRLLYLLFHIDTNVINARGKPESMNQIEKWASDEVILVNISGVSFKEALVGNNDARTKKALTHIYTIIDVDISPNDSLYQKIETALFPGGAQTQNQKNDIKVVYEAAKYGAILITNDGASKTQPGGILGNRENLRNHLTIYSDAEAVEFIRTKIQERDDFNRRVAKKIGGNLPEWTGIDCENIRPATHTSRITSRRTTEEISMPHANEFLEPDQLEDFRSCFKGSGFSLDDFELMQQRGQSIGMSYDPQAGKVIVRCKVTAIEKVYELSSGNAWPSDFSGDLHHGIFGRKS